MQEDDARAKVETYRRLVLEYEAIHAEINALLDKNRGTPEQMSAEELGRYRALAHQRDALYNDLRVLERQLLRETGENDAVSDDDDLPAE